MHEQNIYHNVLANLKYGFKTAEFIIIVVVVIIVDVLLDLDI